MARPIAPTPKLNSKATRKFLKKVAKDSQRPARPIPTPKVDEAIKMIMADAENRKK